MDLKKLLVPLDASIYTDGATETACRLARAHDASVSGVAVLDSPEIRSSIIPAVGPYYPMMVDAVQAKISHADQVLRDSLERFSRTCEEAGVRHAETEYEGIPAQKLLESSIFFDLVVIGLETHFHFETRSGRGDTIDLLLEATATPVLAVPPTGMGEPKRAIVAFDGSFGASRALRDFLITARPYDPELVVVAADIKPEQSQFLLGNLQDYLASHGFGKVETIASEESIEDTLTPSLIEGVDVIVAGIHSKHRVKDLFVGSFTKKLIRGGKTSLFLSH